MMFKHIAQSTLALALLTSAFTTLPAVTGQADVLFNQEFKFFKVQGTNSQQIFRDFQKKSPIKAKGKYDATLGVAAIKLTPEVEYEVRGKRCHVRNARVTADVVIHLPRWVNYKKADNFSKLGWDKLFDNIKSHELEHAAIAKDYANRIQKKMQRQRPRANCEILEAALKKSSHKLIVKHDKAQRKFDLDETKRLFKNRQK